jgi:hypothetical protein
MRTRSLRVVDRGALGGRPLRACDGGLPWHLLPQEIAEISILERVEVTDKLHVATTQALDATSQPV